MSAINEQYITTVLRVQCGVSHKSWDITFLPHYEGSYPIRWVKDTSGSPEAGRG